MNAPAEFQYERLANPGQGGTNKKKPYGASPFIRRHFGLEERVKPAPIARKVVPRKVESRRAEPIAIIKPMSTVKTRVAEKPTSKVKSKSKKESKKDSGSNYADLGRYTARLYDGYLKLTDPEGNVYDADGERVGSAPIESLVKLDPSLTFDAKTKKFVPKK
jgi:hypothetical protein